MCIGRGAIAVLEVGPVRDASGGVTVAGGVTVVGGVTVDGGVASAGSAGSGGGGGGGGGSGNCSEAEATLALSARIVRAAVGTRSSTPQAI